MIYSASITSDKLGDSDANRVIMLPVCKGLVYRFEIDFPAGCCGLLQCRVLDGSYQVWPSSRDDSFHGDNCTIGFDDCYLKTAAPFEFRIETVNLDETWAHTIQVRLGMASAEAFMSRYMPSVSWDKFQEVMAEAAIEQDILRRASIEAMAKELGELGNE